MMNSDFNPNALNIRQFDNLLGLFELNKTMLKSLNVL